MAVMCVDEESKIDDEILKGGMPRILMDLESRTLLLDF